MLRRICVFFLSKTAQNIIIIIIRYSNINYSLLSLKGSKAIFVISKKKIDTLMRIIDRLNLNYT